MNHELAGDGGGNSSSEWSQVNFEPFFAKQEKKEPSYEDRLKEDNEYYEVFEKFRFDGDAIFTDIDGTITDNSGEIDERAISSIKKYVEAGGVFVPVTGRARFESGRDIVEKLDLPYIVMNNGAEIFNRNGERIYGSEIPLNQVKETFDIANELGLIWMQNKKNPATGEEYLYSNFTEESEWAMNEVGIVDTVHNEEGRIGLRAKHATSDEVMAIPGQNYKIQMMSPDPDAVQQAYDRFKELGIPCMLNMQSKKTGRFHWVEVIQGTKISGIQWLIDSGLIGDIKTARVVGDGGNDLTMYKELHDRDGNQIPNTYTAVANACDQLKEQAHEILESRYDQGPRGMGKGGAMEEIIEENARMREIQVAAEMLNKLMEKQLLDEQGVMDMINKAKGEKPDIHTETLPPAA